jgi:N-acetylneuraminate synthase
MRLGIEADMKRIQSVFSATRSRRALIIAEIAQAHEGSLGMAHAFVDAVAKTGADAIKFQTHIAAAESTANEPWREHFSSQDKNRYAYWQRMEFTEEHWASLKRHAEEKGLLFISSPFSVEAVTLLTRVGVPCWKIASGEVNSADILEAIGATGLPVLLSSGMSTFIEIDRAITLLRNKCLPVALLQCTSVYPCPLEKIGLNVLQEFRARYECPVGLSDHSGTIFPAFAACALGCDIIEVHVTFSRHMYGPDVPSSLTIEEMGILVQGVRAIERMLDNPLDKDIEAEDMAPMRAIFGKKAVARRNLRVGDRLTSDDVSYKKTIGGIPAFEFDSFLGKTLLRDVATGTAFLPEHLGYK